jgi:hypothetical protein
MRTVLDGELRCCALLDPAGYDIDAALSGIRTSGTDEA